MVKYQKGVYMQQNNQEVNILGKAIRRLRLERGWKEDDLADISGVPRGTIDIYERGVVKNHRAEYLFMLARAFNIDALNFFMLTGFGKYFKAREAKKPIKDMLDELYMQLPVEVPVYDDFKAVCEHRGVRINIEPVNIIYRSMDEVAGYLEAYVASGADMEPLIEDGDILVVNRGILPSVGNIVICLSGDGESVLVGMLLEEEGIVKVVNNKIKVRNDECRVCCVVVTMRRNLVEY